GGLGAFLVAGRPEQGDATAPIWIWVLIAGLVGLITGGLVKLARRLAPEKEAPVLGAGAGMLFGLQSALTHTAIGRLLDDGLLAMLLHWSPYAVAAVAVTGTLLLQSAFRLEPLEASYPPLAAVEPLAGIAIGLGVLGSSVRTAPLWLVIEALGLLVMTGGVWVLAKAAVAYERSLEKGA
ncbi:DMT family transporter, partial [Actinomadura sp. CNU-125]|uniref:DMT family transporter n=1 Tax=Actinomadura sp. CNU-125 TaxID=1904961 RepID=UPI000A3EAD59